jgi:hypothetical protein
MRYIVEFIGDDYLVYGAQFPNRAGAEEFIAQLQHGFLDYYEEAIVHQGQVEVRQRTTRFRQIDGEWTAVGP